MKVTQIIRKTELRLATIRLCTLIIKAIFTCKCEVPIQQREDLDLRKI